MAITFIEDDGGRAKAGFKGRADDCVCRAIAIAAALPYREVYDELNRRVKAADGRGGKGAREGVKRPIYEAYLRELGFTWTPTMKIGAGVTMHLRASELPRGRIIVRLSRHLAAVVDGELHDTFDCSRGGTRAVYGVFARTK
jgi:hypothetical protein